ncbi:hypothetical protein [Treponema porcinum]|uniref:hypothetical protein n=1 Tax=Treponema porcinum TaxID=261392 RepID=UPI002A7F7E77|nr:hypothetical protein [Treponema porcinum]MDY4468716.1 hypothetical protein [Treponema porcinum]
MKFSRKETVKISIIYSLILIFANKLKNTEQYKKYSDSFYQSVAGLLRCTIWVKLP